MSLLFENKSTLIHVTCEVVVLGVLVFWVNRKTSNLWEQVDDLSQRLEEQEEKIQNHERIIKQLIETINQSRVANQSQKPKTHKNQVIVKNVTEDIEDINVTNITINDLVEQSEDTTDLEELEETESEMDEALKEELEELKTDFSESNIQTDEKN